MICVGFIEDTMPITTSDGTFAAYINDRQKMIVAKIAKVRRRTKKKRKTTMN